MRCQLLPVCKGPNGGLESPLSSVQAADAAEEATLTNHLSHLSDSQLAATAAWLQATLAVLACQHLDAASTYACDALAALPGGDGQARRLSAAWLQGCRGGAAPAAPAAAHEAAVAVEWLRGARPLARDAVACGAPDAATGEWRNIPVWPGGVTRSLHLVRTPCSRV